MLGIKNTSKVHSLIGQQLANNAIEIADVQMWPWIWINASLALAHFPSLSFSLAHFTFSTWQRLLIIFYIIQIIDVPFASHIYLFQHEYGCSQLKCILPCLSHTFRLLFSSPVRFVHSFVHLRLSLVAVI